MSLYANLARIMGDLGPIEKKGKISSQGSGPSYKFARDSDVLAAAAPKMADAGIVLVPERVQLLSMEPTMSGKQMIANIKSSWLCTDGADSIRFETFGQGADSGDKALPKAQSNARKYAFFMLYHIVTGDDPDHWSSHEQERGRGAGPSASSPRDPAPAARYRQDELLALVAAKGLDREALERYAAIAGVAPGARATNEQTDLIIEYIEGHGTDAVIEPPVTPAGVSDSAPTDGPEVVPPAASGPPPKPGTDEYKALPVQDKANARAYWSKHQDDEQESLAELMGAPA